MIISSIEKQKSKYRVYLDGVYAFSLYPKEIEKFNIAVNHTIDENTVRIIMEIVNRRGVVYAYHLLSKKDYTSYELYVKLLKAGVPDNDIELILEKLINQGFVNDSNFVKRYFQNNYLHKSYKQITYNLKNKGISIELINQIMPREDNDEFEAAKRITLKRLRGKKELSYEDKYKLYNYLVGKGFSSDTARRVVGNLAIEYGE